MEKRILIPVDFSRNSLNATRYALDLLSMHRCTFYLLNVFRLRGYSIDNMMVPEPGDKAYDAAKDESEAGLVKFMGMLKLHPENPLHGFHTISVFNSLVYGVKNQIAKKDIDLVVMGTRGATDAQSIIFGTNAVNVMEEVTECPVLTVPSDYQYAPPREIVFPTDFKSPCRRREMNQLLEIARDHGSVIRVLHIVKEAQLGRDQQSNKELLHTILIDTPHEFHNLTNLKVHAGIGAFVASRNSDMIVFMNRKHSFLGKILAKPLVRELGYHYQIPIMELNTIS
jgi:nucleotide-binding universal stress UspA family protein